MFVAYLLEPGSEKGEGFVDERAGNMLPAVIARAIAEACPFPAEHVPEGPR